MMLAALLSGLGLFLSSHPVHAWPLQAVCLIPWLWALRRSRSPRRGLLLGAVVGLSYALPLVLWLEFPLLMGLGLAVYSALLWMALGALVAWLFRGPAVVAGLAAGGAAVVLQWVNVSLIPVWGTAQAFTRVWSAFPAGAQLVAVTGILGLVFVVVSVQALAVSLPGPSGRPVAIVLVALLGAVVVLDVVGWTRPSDRTLKVAAIGWVTAELSPSERASDQALVDGVVAPLVREAAHQGARLVVLPETAFAPAAGDTTLFQAMRRLAHETGVVIAVGYFDRGSQRNTLLFSGTADEPRYHKTHLIMGFEDYTPGTGERVLVDVAGVRVGALICQDDNFTDLARGLASEGAEIVVVPTNDWRQVKDDHLENARFRPIENGFGVVRAASNGISAIVSPRGELLASRDHFTEGAGLVVADLPIRPGRTFYTRLGDWPMLALGVLIFLWGIRAVRVGAPSRS